MSNSSQYSVKDDQDEVVTEPEEQLVDSGRPQHIRNQTGMGEFAQKQNQAVRES
jgi:hypothetical protein